MEGPGCAVKQRPTNPDHHVVLEGPQRRCSTTGGLASSQAGAALNLLEGSEWLLERVLEHPHCHHPLEHISLVLLTLTPDPFRDPS